MRKCVSVVIWVTWPLERPVTAGKPASASILCGDLLALTKTNFANQLPMRNCQKVSIHSVYICLFRLYICGFTTVVQLFVSKGRLYMLSLLSLLGEYLHLYDQSNSFKLLTAFTAFDAFSPRSPLLLFSDFSVTAVSSFHRLKLPL